MKKSILCLAAACQVRRPLSESYDSHRPLFTSSGRSTPLYRVRIVSETGQPCPPMEEGFIEIHHNGRSDRLLFPKLPGSLYHASKVHDSTNIEFACRIWGLRATDLNQGVVYGIETEETKLDPRLLTRFDYDELFGTALNTHVALAMLALTALLMRFAFVNHRYEKP